MEIVPWHKLTGFTDEAIENFFYESCSDPIVYRGTLRIPKDYTRDDARAFHAYLKGLPADNPDSNSVFAMVVGGKTLVGTISMETPYPEVSHRTHVREVGYYTHPKHRGKGYCTEALKQLLDRTVTEAKREGKESVLRIQASVFEWNASSRRVLERNGFTVEGRSEALYRKAGEYITCVSLVRVVRW